MTTKPRIPALRATLFAALFAFSFGAEAATQDQEPRRDVDIVIALDVSGSMDGLIESAKQRLWDITNELGRARPLPALRVAILSYGNPDYGSQSGFVQVDLPFTSDLDAVSQTLFAFRTNGGDEYVASVVSTSLGALDWSRRPEALRVIFVAGNESAEQDRRLGLEEVMAVAREKDVIVNAIFCGSDRDPAAHGWQRVAALSNGFYASIDQNVAAAANIATPMDGKLAALSEALNSTYLAYGERRAQVRKSQRMQDSAAASMSAPAAASRAVTKAGALYQPKWDLVGAVESGEALAEVAPSSLPAEMQAMEPAEREAYVAAKASEREALEKQVATLAEERRAYMAEKRRAMDSNTPKGLDTVMLEGIRSLAEAKGFTFEAN